MVTVLMMGGDSPASAQQLNATQVYGGPGGNAFSDFQPPTGARVAEVRVRSGNMVDSVQMVYALADNSTVVGPRHGGSGGNNNSFRLDGDEYIIGLAGRYGDYLDALRIITNKRTSPTYGGRGGRTDFRVDVPSWNMALGFAGRAGQYVDALGLVYAAIYSQQNRYLAGTISARPGRLQQTAIVGGNGGSAFADQNVTTGARISEIRIRSGERVDSLQVVYMLSNGTLQEGPRHGGTGGNAFVFTFDPDEYLVGISGRTGQMVDSIRIITNKRTSLTFGGRGGDRDFQINIPSGSTAIGFAGRSGNMIDAIGLTCVANTTNRRLP
jgi:hypothetical protein